MSGQILLLDYGTCNVNSVYKILKQHNADVVVGHEARLLRRADKIILPGIGHFEHAMLNLNAHGIIEALHEQVLTRHIPVLGICLGMQLMADFSTEGNTAGLGWVKGKVAKLSTRDSLRYKIPHIGWNTAAAVKHSRLMEGVNAQDSFYFTHSYHFVPADESVVLSKTVYEDSFVSAIEQDHIFGCQYHLEKSYNAGSLILRNFAAL